MRLLLTLAKGDEVVQVAEEGADGMLLILIDGEAERHLLQRGTGGQSPRSHRTFLSHLVSEYIGKEHISLEVVVQWVFSHCATPKNETTENSPFRLVKHDRRVSDFFYSLRSTREENVALSDLEGFDLGLCELDSSVEGRRQQPPVVEHVGEVDYWRAMPEEFLTLVQAVFKPIKIPQLTLFPSSNMLRLS